MGAISSQPSRWMFVLALCAALGFADPPAETKLTASDGAAGDQFGFAAASDGDTVVVAALLDDDAGSAYVFVRSGTTWTEQQKLTASDAAAFDFFGRAVAISGDTVVVGAPLDDDAGISSGSAYVFVRSGTTWTQQQKLTASDAAGADFFGTSVGIDGDTVVVGAFGDDDAGSNSGSAYVFERSGTTWTQQQKLTAGDAAAGDFFGYAVAIDGDTVVAGARLDDDAGSNSGSAYVFERSGTTWTQQQKLIASDAAAGDNLGWAVAISGDTFVVGAWFPNDAFPQNGSAYVFVRSGTTWAEQQKLTASDAVLDPVGDRFGTLLAISGDTVVVGAHGDSDAGLGSGSAYVFVRSGTTWAEQQKLTASDAAALDLFGHAIAISGGTVVVGAIGDDDAGFGSGSAYFYDSPDPVALLQTLINDIQNLNLQQGIENSLDAKADAALQALNDLNTNNDQAAINTLQAFIDAVTAQSGKKITVAQADDLIADAEQIIALLQVS